MTPKLIDFGCKEAHCPGNLLVEHYPKSWRISLGMFRTFGADLCMRMGLGGVRVVLGGVRVSASLIGILR